ncbi:hypothetical protein DL95DRAFT_387775, partial [Leptodontidium sp. 2 PMI_412]
MKPMSSPRSIEWGYFFVVLTTFACSILFLSLSSLLQVSSWAAATDCFLGLLSPEAQGGLQPNFDQTCL